MDLAMIPQLYRHCIASLPRKLLNLCGYPRGDSRSAVTRISGHELLAARLQLSSANAKALSPQKTLEDA